MKQIYQKFSSGFTLIELLVVITILGVLATLALVTLNPAEAQKKGRDTQRLKDMATLQSIVEQYMTDNPGALTLAAGNSSAAGANSCGATGWLSVALGATTAPALCKYANVIPIDPSNRSASVTLSTGLTETANAYYAINFSGGTYKICTRLESTANAAKLVNDGEGTGNTSAAKVFAVFSGDITCYPGPP